MLDQRKDLFDFVVSRVNKLAQEDGIPTYHAFSKWFAEFYFQNIDKIDVYDGTGDGKIDIVVQNKKGNIFVINSKYTEEYSRNTPVSHYDEIVSFWQAFKNEDQREDYLQNVVRKNLRDKYSKLFRSYNDGKVKLFFLTNQVRNEKQHSRVKNQKIEYIYLDDLNNYLLEFLENAMPKTDELVLSDIQNCLTAVGSESIVPTSIVFARLVDFIKYMDNDPLDLLFARNVRLWLDTTETNKEIQRTFTNYPEEFVYSNNGITILCDSHNLDPGLHELKIINPRVVNGSQTLHSIRKTTSPSIKARVMVKIISLPFSGETSTAERKKRKQIVHNISIRTNMQNPIKKENLVANDDFQLELSRYMWSKKYYYERRKNEWKIKSKDLKELRIQKGTDIKHLMQILSCLYYDRKGLGPVVSLATSGDIYESSNYKIIRETSPEIAFLAWRVFESISKDINTLNSTISAKKLALAKYHTFGLVVAITKKEESIKEAIEELFELQEKNINKFNKLIEKTIKYIIQDYKIIGKQYLTFNRIELEFSTYLKNNTNFDNLVKGINKL